MTPTSGTTSDEKKGDVEVVRKPAGDPADRIELTRAEHNRTQAELRLLRQKVKEFTAPDEEREAAQEAQAEKLSEAENKAKAAERRAEVAEELATRGISGKRAALLRDLIAASPPPEGETVAAALDRIAAQYEITATVEPKPPPRKTPPVGPANMPNAIASMMPQGYVSPEEYKATPPAVRMTPAFRQRVAISEPIWRRQSGNRVSRIAGG